MTRLKVLDLEENVILDVSALSGLIRLVDFDLAANADLRCLCTIELDQPKMVDLEDNLILDVSALSNLTRVGKAVSYQECGLEPLATL